MKPNRKTITMDLEDYEKIKEFELFLSTNPELGNISDIKKSLLGLRGEGTCLIRGEYPHFSFDLFPRQFRISSKESVLNEIRQAMEFFEPEFLKENRRLNKEVDALKEDLEALNQSTFIKSKTIKRKKKGWFWE